MPILVAGLPLLLVIFVANVVTARGSAGARVAFNLSLFALNLLLVVAGAALGLRLAAGALPALEPWPFDPAQSGAALAAMGVWGMVMCLRPVRSWLGRWLPALDGDSAVHTLALVIAGYLIGSNLVSLTPAALQALDEANVAASLQNVLLQMTLFVLAAFVGVGLLVRRRGAALTGRLGLVRPTVSQLWTGVRWMVFFVLLQACIGGLWVLLDPDRATQMGGINEALLGSFDTVWEWFLLAAAAGLGEELLFRGAMQPIFGVLPTALIFALSHVQYGLSPAMLTVFLLALALGIIRKRSNTTVAIIVHAGYNFILGLLSLLFAALEPFAR